MWVVEKQNQRKKFISFKIYGIQKFYFKNSKSTEFLYEQ